MRSRGTAPAVSGRSGAAPSFCLVLRGTSLPVSSARLISPCASRAFRRSSTDARASFPVGALGVSRFSFAEHQGSRDVSIEGRNFRDSGIGGPALEPRFCRGDECHDPHSLPASNRRYCNSSYIDRGTDGRSAERRRARRPAGRRQLGRRRRAGDRGAVHAVAFRPLPSSGAESQGRHEPAGGWWLYRSGWTSQSFVLLEALGPSRAVWIASP